MKKYFFIKFFCVCVCVLIRLFLKMSVAQWYQYGQQLKQPQVFGALLVGRHSSQIDLVLLYFIFYSETIWNNAAGVFFCVGFSLLWRSVLFWTEMMKTTVKKNKKQNTMREYFHEPHQSCLRPDKGRRAFLNFGSNRKHLSLPSLSPVSIVFTYRLVRNNNFKKRNLITGHFHDAELMRLNHFKSSRNEPSRPSLHRWVSHHRANADVAAWTLTDITPVFCQTVQCSSPVFHTAQYATSAGCTLKDAQCYRSCYLFIYLFHVFFFHCVIYLFIYCI